MKRIELFSLEEIQKRKRLCFWLGLLSVLTYIAIALLFFFFHSRSNSIWFLIVLYVLTLGEVILAFYLFFYRLSRLKRLEKDRNEEKGEKTDSFVYVREGDLCLQDYLPYRSLVFKKEKEKQERTLYLLASVTTLFEEGKAYEIKHIGPFISGLEEVSNEKLPSTFRDFFHFEWWKGLLLTFVLCVVWHYSFNAKDALKEEEIIRIYATGKPEKEGVESLFSKHLKHDVAQINYVDIGDDSYTQTLLQSKGLLDGDIFLLTEKYWDPLVASNSVPLPEELLNAIEAASLNVTFVEYEGKKVGVFVDGEKETYFPIQGYFAKDFSFYLSINKNSTNAIWEGKDSSSRCAYGVLLEMLGVPSGSL